MKKQELATVLRDRLELGSLKDANRVIDEFAKILSEAMVADDVVDLRNISSRPWQYRCGYRRLHSRASLDAG